MQDDEGDVGHAGLLEVLAAPVPVVELLRPVLVGAFGNLNGDRRTKILDTKPKVTGGFIPSLLPTWKGLASPRITARGALTHTIFNKKKSDRIIHVRKSCRKRRVRQYLKWDRTKLIKPRTIVQSGKALIIHQIFAGTFVGKATKEIGAASKKKDNSRQMMNISLCFSGAASYSNNPKSARRGHRDKLLLPTPSARNGIPELFSCFTVLSVANSEDTVM